MSEENIAESMDVSVFDKNNKMLECTFKSMSPRGFIPPQNTQSSDYQVDKAMHFLLEQREQLFYLHSNMNKRKVLVKLRDKEGDMMFRHT